MRIRRIAHCDGSGYSSGIRAREKGELWQIVSSAARLVAGALSGTPPARASRPLPPSHLHIMSTAPVSSLTAAWLFTRHSRAGCFLWRLGCERVSCAWGRLQSRAPAPAAPMPPNKYPLRVLVEEGKTP